jgi:hypothetical protein
MINDSPGDLIWELHRNGYLSKAKSLPLDLWESALVSLARKVDYSSIRSGRFQSLTQKCLQWSNLYQPYTLPHAELLVGHLDEL